MENKSKFESIKYAYEKKNLYWSALVEWNTAQAGGRLKNVYFFLLHYSASASGKIMNSAVLLNAKCTVGILSVW